MTNERLNYKIDIIVSIILFLFEIKNSSFYFVYEIQICHFCFIYKIISDMDKEQIKLIIGENQEFVKNVIFIMEDFWN